MKNWIAIYFTKKMLIVDFNSAAKDYFSKNNKIIDVDINILNFFDFQAYPHKVITFIKNNLIQWQEANFDSVDYIDNYLVSIKSLQNGGMLEIDILDDKNSATLNQLNLIANKYRDITGELNKKFETSIDYVNAIQKYYQYIIAHMPGNVYWMDKHCKMLGCNSNTLHMIGMTSLDQFIGLTYEEIGAAAGWTEKQELSFKADDTKVIETKMPILNKLEPVLYNTEGEPIYYITNRVPLFNEKGDVIGVIGISIDITDKKNTEKLEAEMQRRQLKETQLQRDVQEHLLKEQNYFLQVANQVAHDIRSPLSSLLMIVKSCKEIPEEYRIALREAAISIGDIAEHLLTRYQNKDLSIEETDKSKPLLVSAILWEILAEKKYQYQNLNIKFDLDFASNAQFAFIKIQPSAFRRAISNIINNAVDIFDGKAGKVIIRLIADSEWLNILIIDNGKGMPEEIRNMILEQVAVTSGKDGGHGIGFAQVWETLQRYQGILSINSLLDKGTEIKLSFPRIKAPNWIAEAICLNTDDIIVILDDDVSIHSAWNTHFDTTLKSYPTLQIKHFHLGDEALEFIKQSSPEQMQKIFLLTDFELLKQDLSGLQVVVESKITRSILVTSHYADKLVLVEAAKSNTKILPKQLAPEIPILVVSSSTEASTMERTVDVVLLDDDIQFTNILKAVVFSGLSVDEYQDPHFFLKQVQLYNKNTRIYLDYHYEQTMIKGLEIARQLHEMGFSQLYLLSGQPLIGDDIPDYLTVIRKDNIEAIQKSLER